MCAAHGSKAWVLRLTVQLTGPPFEPSCRPTQVVIRACLAADGVALPASCHLLTNRLVFDLSGCCVAVEPSSPPASREGKLRLLTSLDALADRDLVLMVGDKPVDARVACGLPPLRSDAAGGGGRRTLSFGFYNTGGEPSTVTAGLAEYRATFDILAEAGNACSFAPLVALLLRWLSPPRSAEEAGEAPRNGSSALESPSAPQVRGAPKRRREDEEGGTVRPCQLRPFGACVEDCSVATLLASGAQLRSAWLAHGGLLVVRGLSSLSSTEMHAVSALFGDVEDELDESKRAFQVDGRPSVMRIGNVRDAATGELIATHTISAPLPPDGSPQYREDTRLPVWHTDSTYRQRPPIGSVLYCKAAPPSGAATCFSDAAGAFDALDSDVQERLRTLECVCSLSHHDAKVKARGSPESITLTAAQRRSNPPQRVPCVLRHPLTGRESLYGMNSGTFAVLPRGTPLSDAELDRCELDAHEMPSVQRELRALLPFATQPRFVVKWQWAVGDLVVWDNRCTMHCATGFAWREHTREMWRTTIVSDFDEPPTADALES